ncbi:Type 1 glutamine amidotransferase-like domain-containing protein [Sphingomonas sp. MMS24-J13]|uniref:Type 1 glutamine amidotransferase-like domain-containing protein n=1 Tax=Sphingomonas sp. MMS24-J13 TaxID=3238686 RepID=UPI00384C0529
MAHDEGEISRRAFMNAGAVAAAAATLTGGASAVTAQPAGEKQPTILAIGGGGFFPQPWETQSLMPEYLMALTPAKNPKICWLGPASGESANSFNQFVMGWSPYPAQVKHFSIYDPETLDFVDYLMGMDIVFVGGGSTKNLMALWREWGFDKALHTAWQNGVVMAGSSAGQICWYQSGLTNSFPKVLAPVKATGFLPGSVTPHYNVRPDRKSQYRKFIADGSLDSPGLALENDVAGLYRGTQLVELVSSRKTAAAFKLTRTATGYDEVPLPVRYLGS